ncbi:hypothetical protein CCP3SC1_70054 [Gammaproteobacteria bacterium]
MFEQASRYNLRGNRVGEGHPRSKLTTSDVSQVRELHLLGATYQEISVRFGVHHKHVARICRFESRPEE